MLSWDEIFYISLDLWCRNATFWDILGHPAVYPFLNISEWDIILVCSGYNQTHGHWHSSTHLTCMAPKSVNTKKDREKQNVQCSVSFSQSILMFPFIRTIWHHDNSCCIFSLVGTAHVRVGSDRTKLTPGGTSVDQCTHSSGDQVPSITCYCPPSHQPCHVTQWRAYLKYFWAIC